MSTENSEQPPVKAEIKPPAGSPSLEDGLLSTEGKKKSTVAADCCRFFGVPFAIFVRLILIGISLAAVALTVEIKGSPEYWLLSAPISLIIVEGAVTVITRKGQERQWVCLCFVFYLFSTVPSIWIMHIDKLQRNSTEPHAVTVSADAGIGISSDDVYIIVQCLLFVMIFCRWLLPRGLITRDQLSQLMFVFIGMSSDVMELLQLFAEEKVTNNWTLVYIILASWSFSLFQFTFVLTMVHNPKKAVITINKTGTDPQGTVETPNGTVAPNTPDVVRKFLQTEIWSLVVTIVMQDAPFLAIRFYVLIHYQVLNYTIIFFTCKNILVMLLLLYRFIVICVEKSEDDDDDDDNDLKPCRQSHSMVNQIHVTQSRHPNGGSVVLDVENGILKPKSAVSPSKNQIAPVETSELNN